MPKIDALTARIGRETGQAYDLLVSGRLDRIELARARIAAYRESEPIWRSLDVVDMTKRWINQDRSDRDAKDIALLETMVKDAWELGDHLRGAERWKYKGRMARALFYCGRFQKARARFAKAVRLIGDPTKWKPEDREAAYDIYAAQAEVEVYLGFPVQAITYLDRIPPNKRVGWCEWSRAFALHQRGFVERVSFGRASSPDDTMPGPPPGANSWYAKSNALIASIQGELEPIEQFDSHLLMAANYGALYRLGDHDAQQQAFDAFEVFKSAPPPSSNATWTWAKELRGRFPIRKFGADPGGHTRPAIKTWRTAYGWHYRDNLRVCDFPDLALDDGEIDEQDEHDDDAGE